MQVDSCDDGGGHLRPQSSIHGHVQKSVALPRRGMSGCPSRRGGTLKSVEGGSDGRLKETRALFPRDMNAKRGWTHEPCKASQGCTRRCHSITSSEARRRSRRLRRDKVRNGAERSVPSHQAVEVVPRHDSEGNYGSLHSDRLPLDMPSAARRNPSRVARPS